MGRTSKQLPRPSEDNEDVVLRRRLIDDGIVRHYACYAPIYITKENTEISGICPHCMRIGQVSASCLSCPLNSFFQVPVVYYKDPHSFSSDEEDDNNTTQHQDVMIPAMYRIDTLFYALHMPIYNGNDPASVLRGYTPPDPYQMMVPINQQGTPTYHRFKGEPLLSFRYNVTTCDRSYPRSDDPRREMMDSLLTYDFASLFNRDKYKPVFQEMIQEWKVLSSNLQTQATSLSDFLQKNGPRQTDDDQKMSAQGESKRARQE